MQFPLKIAVLALPLFVAACTTTPTGPNVMVLPSASKSFSQFRADDMECRNYALESVGGVSASQAASDSGVKSAVVGTAIGAAAGAAIGGEEGAAIGAGTGLLIGGLAGTQAAQASGYDLQHRYDVGYIQCMYALGHQVPVSGRVYRQPRPTRYVPPPPPPGIPPPPPGTPPPPPPGITAP
jgi:outer membrane lipoprotein SlyB